MENDGDQVISWSFPLNYQDRISIGPSDSLSVSQLHMTSPRPISPFAIPAGYEQARRGRWIDQSKLNEAFDDHSLKSRRSVPGQGRTSTRAFAHVRKA